MSRVCTSLIWLVGGIVGTVAIPVGLFLVLAVLEKVGARESVTLIPRVLMGLSVYVVVPVGVIVSAFMAFTTYRKLGRETKGLNQPVETTAAAARPPRLT